ncbi:MAG: MFS transporter [Halobacteriaceae archaeon]
MTVEPSRERLFAGYAGRLSIALSLGWLAIRLGREAVPPLLTAIAADLSLAPAETGVALSVLWGTYALTQYPGGSLADALSRTTVLVAALGCSAAGFALLAVAGGYPSFLVALGFVGVGSGLYFVPTRALLSDLFVARRSQAFGVNAAAGTVGGAGAAALAVLVLHVATWRAAFLPTAGLLVGVGLLLHRWSEEGYVLAGASLDVRETGRRVLGVSRVRRLLAAYALFAFAAQAGLSFLPTLLQAEAGFSAPLASAAFGLLFVVGTVVSPVAGGLADRVARTAVAAAALAVAAAGLAGVLLAPGRPTVVAGVVVYAVGIRAFPPAMQAYAMDLFPAESMGGDFGALKTVYTGLGSLGPAYVGVVAQRADYAAAFAGLVGCLVLGFGTVLALGRS